MENEPQVPRTTTKTKATTSATLVAVTTALLTLPQPYSHWVEIGLAIFGGVGLVAMTIPAPPAGSKWVPAYKVISFFAANWGEATNIASAMYSASRTTTPEVRK